MSPGVAPPKPIPFSLMEHTWLLRRLRADKDKLLADMQLLQERLNAGHNGEITNAYRAMDGDKAILDQILRRMWVATL